MASLWEIAIREQARKVIPPTKVTVLPTGVAPKSGASRRRRYTPAFTMIGNQAPFDFDVSVKDIYSALKVGATMVIIPKRLFSIPAELLDFLCERRVTTLIWAVSALCLITQLKGFTYKVPSRVNKVLFSGEAMPVKFLTIWQKYLPNASYVNLYGPTEIT